MVEYDVAAHPTMYKGVQFRSRLEARWAAFFVLAGWEWEYEPIDLTGWVPDFIVRIPCSHSDCNGYHVLFAEVKPYVDLKQFEGHPCTMYPFGGQGEDPKIPADASASFGNNPHVTSWVMAHGSGGAVYCVHDWIKADVDKMWKEAGNMVQWNKPKPSMVEQLRVCQTHFEEIGNDLYHADLLTVCEVNDAIIKRLEGAT